MKPRKISKKLNLNKKTIARLNDSEMNAAQGGIDWSRNSRCSTPMCCH
jgi:natural product precursor